MKKALFLVLLLVLVRFAFAGETTDGWFDDAITQWKGAMAGSVGLLFVLIGIGVAGYNIYRGNLQTSLYVFLGAMVFRFGGNIGGKLMGITADTSHAPILNQLSILSFSDKCQILFMILALVAGVFYYIKKTKTNALNFGM